ncbi:MAG TPA: methionyl-tRNA formyltransferase, partial [Stellaceae bacterium]|nr:methionyl-tRNA formyltransferase [Stellaceae bacterium]
AAGRGMELKPSPVHKMADRFGFPVLTPKTLRTEEAAEIFRGHDADVAVVVAYGMLLPKAILEAPELGCLNLHASLLPRWRGAAPIQRAIQAGDDVTGITVMAMEAGLDTGPILLQEVVPIGPDTTAGELTAKLAELGARLILSALDQAVKGRIAPRPQPRQGVTYARKVGREEGRLDWRRPAEELERLVRAFDPWPGTFFEHKGERIQVMRAAVLPEASGRPPGSVLDEALAIACGAGVLRLLRVRRAGRAPLPAADFLRGFPIPPGRILPCPATS